MNGGIHSRYKGGELRQQEKKTVIIASMQDPRSGSSIIRLVIMRCNKTCNEAFVRHFCLAFVTDMYLSRDAVGMFQFTNV